MAAVELVVQDAEDVTTVVYEVASALGHFFKNPTADIALWVLNESLVVVTAAVVVQEPCDFGVVHTRSIACAASGKTDVEPLNRHFYNDREGKVQFTLDLITSVGVAAVRFRPAK